MMIGIKRFIGGRASPAVALMLALSACGGEPEQDQADAATETAPPVQQPAAPAAGTEVATEYAPALNVDLSQMTRTESGLRYQVLQEGEGEAVEAGDRVSVQYTGWLPAGEQFDSGTYALTVGAGEAIRGWDEGLVGMKPGEKRRLIIPPSLGYGPGGRPPVIPSNATLVFDVQLPK